MEEDRYEIIKLLGKGRTGGVYEAEDTTLNRKVALRRFFAQTKQTELDEYKEQFEKVTHSISSLQHPNLLRVYDAGIDEDGAYIISQLLEGDSLHDRSNGTPLTVYEVYDLAQQILDALSTAHSEGFVHGAISPGSILMTPRARGGYLYVILDMGLSRLAPLIQGKESLLSKMADPAILAPELFDGSSATKRADLYMLGNILYMGLAGGHPFGGIPTPEAERMHAKGLPPITQYRTDIPEDFVLWIEKLIRYNPEERPKSAVEALKLLPKMVAPMTGNTTAVQPAATQSQKLNLGVPVTPSMAITSGPASTIMPIGQNTTGSMYIPPVLKSSRNNSLKVFLTIVIALIFIIALFFIIRSKKDKAEATKSKTTHMSQLLSPLAIDNS